MADAIVEFEKATVRFSGKKVLGPVNLKINKGDFWGIVGPNGAGKSTLIKVIAGLQHISEGEVRLYNQPLHKTFLGSSKAVRENIGILLQHHSFYPDLPFTVEDVVFFGRAGLPGFGRRYRPSDIESVNHAISELGLDKLRYRLYRELSGGESRKVQLARLLAQKSELLLLDEPTAGLDLEWQERLTQLVEDMYKRYKKTIIMVTHYADHLPSCCNKILLLQKGEVIASGSPEKVMRPDILSALYNCKIEVAERNGRFHAYSLGLRE